MIRRSIFIALSCAVACATSTHSEDDDAGNPANDGSTFQTDTGTTPHYDSGTTTQPDTGTTQTCNSPLIDNMEGATGAIISQCNRVGFWYTYNDATSGATQTPAAGSSFLPSVIPNGGRSGSLQAAHTDGNGFTVWGAGMGFDLNDLGGTSTKAVYDASAYTGFTFWVMSTSGATTVRFNVPTKATDPAGGECTPAAKCSDHFGMSVSLTTSWVQVNIKFSQLQQLGWGTPATFIPSQMYGVEFQFDPSVTFDLWVDDISFQ